MKPAKAALVAWFAVMVLLGAGLLARHVVAMPAPHTNAAAMARLRPADDHGWLVVHALYSDCRCSQRIAAHLAERGTAPGWHEIILWVGSDDVPADLRGFDVRITSASELAAFGIEAAPSMVVLDPENHVRYEGGYTSRKQGPVIEDLHVMRDARAGRATAPLPLFGCAVSARLQQQTNVLPAP